MSPRCITLLVSMQLFLFGHAAVANDTQLHVSKDELRRHLENLFSKPRTDVYAEEKARVRKGILDFYEQQQSRAQAGDRMEISEHYYWDEFTPYNGTNLVLIFKGERYGTSEDQVSLVGAHYDSQGETPGVNDNGSGMAALLAIVENLATMMQFQQCPFLNTVIAVAFDHEEKHLVGSRNYVLHLEEEILLKYKVKNFTGAFILETMMNFDDNNNTQIIPLGIDFAFPEQYQMLEENAFRGDFMLAIARQEDAPLTKLLSDQWYRIVGGDFKTTEKYREFDFVLPVTGSPRDWPQEVWMLIRDFFRSDHYSFWESWGNYTKTGLKAIMITDTAEFRGNMQSCYHKVCDDISTVNDDKLEFLQIGAEAVFRSLSVLATGSGDIICLNVAAAVPGISFTLLLLAVVALFVV